jgi:hypothetical protein
MVTANGGGDNISIFLANDDAANFDPAVNIEPAPGSEPFAVVTADFDADGDIDIAAAHEFGETLEIFKHDTTSGQALKFDSAFTFPVGVAPQSLSLGNFDGNEFPDVVVSNSESAQIDIFFNTGGSLGR